jgi:hypothetical protein
MVGALMQTLISEMSVMGRTMDCARRKHWMHWT